MSDAGQTHPTPDSDPAPGAREFRGVDADALFDPKRIEFPVSFDLRTIYVVSKGASVQVDIESILARHAVDCTMTQGLAKPGATYGRFGARVTFSTMDQMHAVYAEIAALPYIKGVF